MTPEVSMGTAVSVGIGETPLEVGVSGVIGTPVVLATLRLATHVVGSWQPLASCPLFCAVIPAPQSGLASTIGHDDDDEALFSKFNTEVVVGTLTFMCGMFGVERLLSRPVRLVPVDAGVPVVELGL